MRVVYYNNCWFTNVGEAFIDLGAMCLINKIFDNPHVACASDMSDYYYNTFKSNESFIKKIRHTYDVKSAKMWKYLKADYIILAGMFASITYLNSPGRELVDNLVAGGAKLILLGYGSDKYDEKEKNEVFKYLKEIKPELIVTRDYETYLRYKDTGKHTLAGLDCAFWVNEVYNPVGFSNKDYDVITFNRLKEPDGLGEKGSSVIRPWHMQFSANRDSFRESFLISDTMYDYLTIYANANKVYTDLVHATIPSLVYGTPVRYWYFDRRSEAFSMVKNLRTDKEGFMTVSAEDLNLQKREIEKHIKKALGILA